MRVLVTGGAGFIGSAVIRHLALEKGYEVLNIDKLTYAGTLTSLRSVEAKPSYRFLKIDICDAAAISSAISTFRPDRVMHLAAESHVDRSIIGARQFVETNILGSFTVLECARAYWQTLAPQERSRFRFLHVSTDEVYGSLGRDGLFSETTPTIQARLTRHRRPHRTTWPRHGPVPTVCRSSSPTARTITAPFISLKS